MKSPQKNRNQGQTEQSRATANKPSGSSIGGISLPPPPLQFKTKEQRPPFDERDSALLKPHAREIATAGDFPSDNSNTMKGATQFKKGVISSVKPIQQVQNNSTKVIQGFFDLDLEYDFSNAQFIKAFKGNPEGIGGNSMQVYLISNNGKQFVLKNSVDKTEAANANIARLGGLSSPDMRKLTGKEAQDLKGSISQRINAGWYLLQKMEGQTIEDSTLESGGENMFAAKIKRLTLSDNQWFGIGQSIAHQLFVLGYDRWKIDIPGQAQTTENQGNTLVSNDLYPLSVIDTVTQNTGQGAIDLGIKFVFGWLKKITKDKTGVAVFEVAGFTEFEKYFEGWKEKGKVVREGFLSFLRQIEHVDLQSEGLDEPRFLQMQQALARFFPRAKSSWKIPDDENKLIKNPANNPLRRSLGSVEMNDLHW